MHFHLINSVSLLTIWITEYWSVFTKLLHPPWIAPWMASLGNGSLNQVSLVLMKANWFQWQEDFQENKCLSEIILNTERVSPPPPFFLSFGQSCTDGAPFFYSPCEAVKNEDRKLDKNQVPLGVIDLALWEAAPRWLGPVRQSCCEKKKTRWKGCLKLLEQERTEKQ